MGYIYFIIHAKIDTDHSWQQQHNSSVISALIIQLLTNNDAVPFYRFLIVLLLSCLCTAHLVRCVMTYPAFALIIMTNVWYGQYPYGVHVCLLCVTVCMDECSVNVKY